ncbi:histone-lysine N-methyltransferase SETD1B-A isoform X2 [Pungitius pungitius]|uniref:histone-lysine N-methyltransferase SETD1B-A isoform X2 n=1 Tax=Pungitius pungitius TaxID=134920 RepID=UPI002E13004B
MSKPGEKNRLNEDHGRKQSSSLANGMDSHPVCGSAEKRSHHWRSYKLIIDPALKKGSHKLYRYDGQTFSMPNPGIPPVDMVRDPRIGPLWSKYKDMDLPVPTFKIDEYYIGPVPPKEVTFARLNDNVREGFLNDMCKKFGEIEQVEILYNPKNKKHLGIAKVVFENVKAAKVAVQSLHKTSVMGNFIHVELDPKGENRHRYFQLLMNGSFTPQTLPVGGEEAREVSPRSLAEALLACEPIRRLSDSGPSAAGGALPTSSSTTPLSHETGYFSLKQDTPQSQGTPHTPRPAGTPFSQDSNFSSRQSTPAYQPSRAESGVAGSGGGGGGGGSGGAGGGTGGGYKSRRHESKFHDAYNRRPERPQYRSNMYRSSAPEQPPFKQPPLTPPEPPPSTPSFTYTPPLPATPNFKSAFSPYQAPLPPAFPPSEPAFHHPAQREGEYVRPPQPQPPQAAATDFLPVKDRPETPPIPEPPEPPEPPPEPSPQPTTPPPQTPERCPSPASPTLDPERNSLDSRIEMLLKEQRTKLLPFLEEQDSDAEVRMDGSPISSSSSQLSPIPAYTSGSQGGPQNSRPISTGLEDISPTPLPESEDEEPVPGTASLMKTIGSPAQEKTGNSDLKDGHFRGHTPTDVAETGHNSSGEDMEISDDEMPGTPTSGGECGKGIVMNSAVSPMQTIPIPPPGFPPLPHQGGYQLPHHHLAAHPGVPHHMLQHMAHYPHGMMPLVQMELMNCLRWEQWSTVPMSFQMQQQMLSRMAQTRGPYQYPQFIDSGASGPYLGPYQPVTMGPAPAAGAEAPGQQWQNPSIPKFNPTVPPPGYDTKKEDPHKATVDGVLLVIVKELKAIMKRDLNRKMVEVVAFRAFDDWWEKKEHSAKVSLTPVKGAEAKEEDRPKPKEPMGSSLLENWNKGEGLGYEGMGLGISLRGAIRLPSFKVKRKDPPEAAVSGDNKRARPSTPVDDELEDEDRDRDATQLRMDDSKEDSDSASAKRRHSRPLELDSEGEEELDTSGKEEESLSDREEEPDKTQATERLSSGKESGDEEGDDEGSSSDSASSDSSDEGASSASSKASSDSSSESADSSEYELSSEEEDDEEEEEEEEEEAEEEASTTATKDVEAQVKVAETSSSSSSSSISSSDEDEGEGETKAACSPPGTAPEDAKDQRSQKEPSIKPKCRPPSPEATEDLKPPSLKGTPVKERDISVRPEHVTGLRPPTPTGALPDSDQEDAKAKGKAEPEEVPCTPGRSASSRVDARSPVPKSVSAALLHLPLPLHPPAGGRSLLHPPPAPLPDLPQRARLPTDEDIPRTPGRDLMERARSLGKSQSTDAMPVTPGGEAPLTGGGLLLISPHIPGSPFSYPAQSPVLGAGVPRTPGRDLTFTPVFPDPAAMAFNRKISTESLDERPVFKEPPASTASGQAPSAGAEASASVPEELPVDVPVASDTAPSKRKPGRPRGKKGASLSAADESLEPSSESALPPHHAQTTSAKTPHRPSPDFREGEAKARAVLPDEDGFLSHEEEEEAAVATKPARRARRGWEELLLDGLSPVTSPPRPYFKPRFEFEEMTILYDIWNEGIDDEDIRLLQITYDKMLQQDNGNDWLNDTLWVNHPATNIPRVKRKRRDDGMRDHMTGCARSEGYYKIDKKDKIKYLQSTKLQLEEPPVDTQGMSIPAQVHASTRSGSERRSEQRRLLSSFACDSDLLKFNQLKFRKKRIRFCKSHIHDWGLFAMEPIAADEMVIEYVGQNIRQVIADMREKRYEEEGIGSSYMFRVDHDTIIDATKCGNFARFINHSCNPNCYAKVITVESQKKIVIYSRQPINVNEEITYDYKFPIEDEKIPCLCGAENCRGTLN